MKGLHGRILRLVAVNGGRMFRHLSDDDGYGPWPAVLDWCLDPSTRLVPR